MKPSDAVRFGALLAQYLVEDQVQKSIELQMGKPDAKMWAIVRGATPLRGYPTVEEAEKQLVAWLLS